MFTLCSVLHKSVSFFQVLIDMDRADEMTGRMEELHKKLHSVYSQIPLHLQKSSSNGESSTPFSNLELPDPEKLKPGLNSDHCFFLVYLISV